MILRLSQKMNSKIKAGKLGDVSLDENLFADWTAHLFVVERTQYIILTNTASLYSFVVNGKGICNAGRFVERALGALREFMEVDGLSEIYQNHVTPDPVLVLPRRWHFPVRQSRRESCWHGNTPGNPRHRFDVPLR